MVVKKVLFGEMIVIIILKILIIVAMNTSILTKEVFICRRKLQTKVEIILLITSRTCMAHRAICTWGIQNIVFSGDFLVCELPEEAIPRKNS